MTASQDPDDQRATVHLKYVFLAFQAPGNGTPVARTARRNWRTAIAPFFSNFRQRFLAWLLAPVDYPLDMSRLCRAESLTLGARRNVLGPRFSTQQSCLERSERARTKA
jgi:hypothetical protein